MFNIQRLKELSFFSNITDADLIQITQLATFRDCRGDEIIIQEDSPADTFFIIVSGKVAISKRFEDGEEMVLAVHSSGDFFGEMALLDERPRSASARALEPATLLEISRSDFETLLQKAPRLAFSMMKELSTRLRGTGSLLISHLQRKNLQLSQAYLDTVNAVVNALEARDPYTRGHTERVTILSTTIAREMGLKKEDLFSIEIGALLHDVGKIGVPDAILHKPGPLAEVELQQLREHPQKGKNIFGNIDYLKQAIPCVLHHHERFDGQGYPDHIEGVKIPLSGRIIAVADAFDAMTSDRPYRRRLDQKQAIGELKKNSGAQFDPEIVQLFTRLWERGDLSRLLA